MGLAEHPHKSFAASGGRLSSAAELDFKNSERRFFKS
jgi:hypothetical protein